MPYDGLKDPTEGSLPAVGDAATPRDCRLVTQAWREDYVRWFIHSLITAAVNCDLGLTQGVQFQSARTIQEVLAVPGPHGMQPDYTTVRRWLKEDWAKSIAAEIDAQVELVTDVEMAVAWPRILRQQMQIAMTGRGRDATLAAQFLANQRNQREIGADTAMGRKIAEILASGRFDGTVTVQEKTATMLLKLSGQDGHSVPPPYIDVTPKSNGVASGS